MLPAAAVTAAAIAGPGSGAAASAGTASLGARWGSIPSSWPTGGLRGASLYPVHVGPGSWPGGLYALDGTTFMEYMGPMLDLAVRGGQNTVRVVNFLASPGGPAADAAAWSNVDRLVAAAAARNLSAVLDLSCFRNRLKDGGVVPYDAALWASFLAGVGARYRSAPNLAFYSLAGEAACPNCRGDPLRPRNATQLTDFYRAASAALRRADPTPAHLISTGGLTQLDWDGGIDWRAIFALPHVGLVAIHAYDRDRNGTGQNGMLGMMPDVAAYARQLSKPFVLEEFGFDQGAFAAEYFDAAEAAAFRRVFAEAAAAGAAGALFWNLDGCNAPPYGDCHTRAQGTFAVNPALALTWDAIRPAAAPLGHG